MEKASPRDNGPKVPQSARFDEDFSPRWNSEDVESGNDGTLLGDAEPAFMTVVPKPKRVRKSNVPLFRALSSPSEGTKGHLFPGLNPFASEGEANPLTSQNCLGKALSFLQWFLFNHRTERALRFVIFFIPAFYCSYDKWCGKNFSYVTALLYTICASLVPPNIAGIAIVCLLIFPACLTAVGFSTAALSAGIHHGILTPRAAMLLIILVPVFLSGLLRVGHFAALTGIAAIMLVYPLALSFFNIFPFVADGLDLKMTYQQLLHALENIANLLPPQLLEDPLVKLIIKRVKEAIAALEAGLVPVKTLHLHIPARLGDFFPDFKLLAGIPFSLTIGKKEGLLASIPVSDWLIKVMWRGKHTIGIVTQLLRYGWIALGLFIASLIFFPPQRYAKSWLRQRLAEGANVSGLLLRGVLGEVDLLTASRRRSSAAVRRVNPADAGALRFGAFNEDFRVEVASAPGKDLNDREAAYVQTSTPRRETSSAIRHRLRAAESQEIYERHRKSTSFIFPDPVEIKNAVQETIKVGRELDGKPQALPFGSVDETIRQLVLSLSDSAPLVMAAALEPSFSNPGLFVSYFAKWPAIIASLRRSLIHTGVLWDTVKPEDACFSHPSFSFTKANATSASASQKFLAFVPGVRREARGLMENHASADLFFQLMDPAYQLVVNSIEAFQTATVGIAMRPSSRGAQKEAIAAIRHSLHTSVDAVAHSRDYFVRQIPDLLAKSPSFRDWKVAVSGHSALCAFNQAVAEAPMQLAVAVDSLVDAESRFSWRAFATNCVAVCVPLLAYLVTLMTGLCRIFCFWTWRWRRQQRRYLATGEPWFRTVSFFSCLRWVIGIMALFIVPVFYTDFRVWMVSRDKAISRSIAVYLQQQLTAKVVPWSLLGFVVTLVTTMEGTLRRASLRLIGVVLGTVSGYLCLLFFGNSNRTAQLLWLCVTLFTAAWIGGNPVSALLGYHPSWGYAVQVFCYQEVIIIVEASMMIQSKEELVAARLVGQLIGISTACIVALVLFPTQACTEIPRCATQALYCNTQSLLALADAILLAEDGGERNAVETSAAAVVTDDIERPVVGATVLSDPRPWDENRHTNKAARIVRILTGTEKVFTKRKPDHYVGPETLDAQRDLLMERSHRYHQDARDALQHMHNILKDATVFRELPACQVDERWRAVSVDLHVMLLHREAFGDLAGDIRDQLRFDARTRRRFRVVLAATKELSRIVEKHFARGVDGCCAGITVSSSLMNLAGCFPPIAARRRRAAVAAARGLLIDLDDVSTRLREALDHVGETYPEVLRTSVQHSQVLSDAGVALAGFPHDLHAWLTLVSNVLRFTEDMKNLIADFLISDDPGGP